uniref:Disease resistance protein RPM1 n=1 Tax=Aegilops tauschii TaxID=37682 RepID=M8BTS3_AEGTA
MEGVLVSAAAGALNSVLEKLGSLLVNEYNHGGGSREIKSLTDELTAMHAFLLKVSDEEDPDVQDKIKHILGKLGKRKADHKIFQDFKKQVIEASERNARYNTRRAFSNTKNATVDPRAFAIFEHVSKLVGIDESKSEVIKLLTEGASIGGQLKLVSIVGSGGMGKTTLANQVYQHLKERFECRAFLSVSRNPNMMNIMRTIHSQVSGLRFADTEAGSIQQVIMNISCFLADKRSEHRWNQLKDSIGRALERNPSVEGMIKILSLSYFDLPPHLKTCLLYLSIFPEDSITERKGLIRRWIAEGFVYKDSIYKAYELGEKYFNELVNRSLIQPVKLGKYGQVLSCRVHDTILDFIVSKSIEENFVTFVGIPSLIIGTQSRVRRLSIQVEGQRNHVMPTSLVLSHVRSLSMFEEDTVNIPSMVEFKHLRSMDFGGCHPLGIWGCRQLDNHHLANVGRLFQLRYLNVAMSGRLRELPEEIGYLQCLEVLDIRKTMVYLLPASIINLGKLKHLLVNNGLTFPDEIAKMQALEMLKCVCVAEQSCNFIEGLGKLQNLRKLHLYFMEMDVEKDQKLEVTASSLRNLGTHNLSSLKMEYLDDNTLLDTAWCTSPPLNLQSVVTDYCFLPKVPGWVKSLANLQKLKLQLERIRDEDLCILGALPALLTLDLEGDEDQTPWEDRRLTVSGETGFKCLSMFTYFAQRDGMDLLFAAGCMRKLEKLMIVFYNCSKKETLSSSPGALDFGLENLSSLVTFECQLDWNTKKGTGDAVKAYMERAAGAHPNKHLTLIFKKGTDRKC